MNQGPLQPPPPAPLPQDLSAMFAQLAAHPQFMAMLQQAAPANGLAPPAVMNDPAPDPSAPAAAQDDDSSSEDVAAAANNGSSSAQNVGLDKDPSTFTAADRERVRWTVEQAKAAAKTKRLQPSDVIVDFKGNRITPDYLKKIQRFVRQATTHLDQVKVADNLANKIHNFLFFKTHYLPSLIHVAQMIEKRHPVTGWAEDHYKSLKLVEVNLKNKIATGRKHGVLAPSTKKRSSSAGAATLPGPSRKRVKTAKQYEPHHDDFERNFASDFEGEFGSNFDDADEDDQEQDDEDDDDNDDAPPSRRSINSSAHATHSSAANSSSARSSAGSSATDPSTSGPPRHSASFEAQPPQRQAPSSALAQLRLANMDDLAAPSPEAVIKALRLRYSALPKAQELLVSKALDQLKTARGCGLDACQSGAQAFQAWLLDLEHVALPQDEDGQAMAADRSFGKVVLERWQYEDTLRHHEAWGSVQNACRLLAALLRLWLLAQNGQPVVRKGTEPAAQEHLTRVCELVREAFDPMSTEDHVEDSSMGQAQSCAVVSSSSSEKPRRNVKKALDKGIVTEDVLRSLPKYATVALLEKGGITVPPGSKAADTSAMLLTAVKKGAIYIDADHVRQAQNKKPIEGDLKKGKKRMLLAP
ncbi:hypothetical protein OC842_007031 [Tilletia horrida]|uniref:Uncharacterized protein n=1 Tax=Tilletia horrida TaxID=155126 RepID=A0AAN6G4P3_9BASI|nr:hypothetical protein OC842_007031 [Tilletia horrida]